ncbi:MAG: hypothetical protein I8H76_08260 [Burkholderiales bacterium]|nr:hypothetical protein [Burkholderiales bacterium]MBH2016473.1 hypothetical protein [Burkholderiales bacterium]
MFAVVRHRLTLALLLCLALVHGCGGGSQTASAPGVGSGGTGSYSAGPISGLGSIIVNGVRYDVDGAALSSEDTAAPGADDLQLGVVVEVEGGAVSRAATGADTAVATRVRYVSEFIGPVSGLPGGGARPTSITVLGQPIDVNAQTVLPTTPLANAEEVVVFGLPDATGRVTATRVDRVSSPPLYKLSGRVQSRNDVARTFTIGQVPQTVSYASGALPAGFAVNAYVRVQVQKTPIAPNEWAAARLGLRDPLVSDDREGRLEGLVSDYVVSGTTATGRVNGTSVNFSAVRGTSGLVNGARVEVEGRFNGGTLVASDLEVEDDSVQREVELHGFASSVTSTSLALNAYRSAFNVAYGVGVVDGGLNLVNGACIEVRGVLLDSGGFQASRIKADNDCH